MTNQYELEDLAVDNKRSLKRLARAIAMSQGQFSLILVCCNSLPLRAEIVADLQEHCTVQIEELTLHPSVNTLFTTILTSLKEQKKTQTLMVLGLESVIAIDQLLGATNLVRDEFRKQFPFPLVLWVNDEIQQKLVRLAPDFKSWAVNPIRFEISNHQSIDWRVTTA